MVLAADPAQDHAGIPGMRVAGRRHRRRLRRRRQHPQLHAVHIQRITGTQHCHALHRSAIDMHAARAGGHLQPQAAPVQADLGQQHAGQAVADAQHAAGLAQHAVHPGKQRMIGLLAIAEMEAQVVHWSQSLANPCLPQAGPATRLPLRWPPPPAKAPPMSRIDIQHRHARSDADARRIVEGIVQQLHQRYGVDGHWDQDDAASLSGPGLQGSIRLAPGQVQVTAELGFLLSVMSGQVESEIRRVLAERLD